MSGSVPRPENPGPFKAEQIREGEPYELSNGHRIYCPPNGERHAQINTTGAEALTTDPEVTSAGIDAGFTPEPGVLRAPDVSVGHVPNETGWIPGAPPLAVEYADTGQDEADLQQKIRELMGAGTKYFWVVRLTGPRRVEVYEHGRPMRMVRPGEELSAPGVLRNRVPIEALFDREAAHEVALRNLLQRKGYENLRDVETKNESRGKALAILGVLAARGLAISEDVHRRLTACEDSSALDRWVRRSVTVPSASALFDEGAPRGE